MTTHPTGDAPAASERVVEAVALELYDDDPITNFRIPIEWLEIKEWSREKYRRRARAAIEAYQKAMRDE